MSQTSIEALFAEIRMWKRRSERALHKPLLLLYALGKCARGEPRMIPYAEVDRSLRPLLEEFGPPRATYHTEYPFWRLQNDQVWELEHAEHIQTRQSNIDAKKSELLRYNVEGGFPEPIYTALRRNRQLLLTIAHRILDAHFPASMHEDILTAVGLDTSVESATHRVRDSKFRTRVLTAYTYSCAVCGFDVRLGTTHVGLDAAHIRWHQAGGPDVERNGLALCVLHHKLFDRGAFTISVNYRIELSEHLYGSNGFEQHLLRYHGAQLIYPVNPQHLPAAEHLSWHHKEVFKGPARYLSASDSEQREGNHT